MILYFLRHASAGEHVANPKKDEKRALDKDGIEQCGYIGRALAALDVQVDADRLQSAEALLRKLHPWSVTRSATRANCRSMLGFAPRPDSPTSVNCWKNMRVRKPSWWLGTIRI